MVFPPVVSFSLDQVNNKQATTYKQQHKKTMGSDDVVDPVYYYDDDAVIEAAAAMNNSHDDYGQLAHQLDVDSKETSSLYFILFSTLLFAVLVLSKYLHEVPRLNKYLSEASLILIIGLIVSFTTEACLKYDTKAADFADQYIQNFENYDNAKNDDDEDASESDEDIAFQRLISFSPNIFFMALLPPILFNSGYQLRRELFLRHIYPIVMFAVIGTIISSITCAMSLWGLQQLNLFSTFDPSLLELFAFGSLIAATDTVSVIAVLQTKRVDPHLFYVVFGESALNDAVALVLFNSFADLLRANKEYSYEAFMAFFPEFLLDAVGSPFLGMAFGFGFAILFKVVDLRRKKYRMLELSLYLMLMYVPFIIAESTHLSGIVTIFFAGLSVRRYVAPNVSRVTEKAGATIFQLVAFLSETCIFLELGLSIFGFSGSFNWDFIIYSLICCLLARGAAIYPLALFHNFVLSNEEQNSSISLSPTSDLYHHHHHHHHHHHRRHRHTANTTRDKEEKAMFESALNDFYVPHVDDDRPALENIREETVTSFASSSHPRPPLLHDHDMDNTAPPTVVDIHHGPLGTFPPPRPLPPPPQQQRQPYIPPMETTTTAQTPNAMASIPPTAAPPSPPPQEQPTTTTATVENELSTAAGAATSTTAATTPATPGGGEGGGEDTPAVEDGNLTVALDPMDGDNSQQQQAAATTTLAAVSIPTPQSTTATAAITAMTVPIPTPQSTNSVQATPMAHNLQSTAVAGVTRTDCASVPMAQAHYSPPTMHPPPPPDEQELSMPIHPPLPPPLDPRKGLVNRRGMPPISSFDSEDTRGSGTTATTHQSRKRRERRGRMLNNVKKERISWEMMHILWFAGLRGAVAYACVREFPNINGNADEFTAATMFIVLFTIVIMGGLTETMLGWLGIEMGVDLEEYMDIFRQEQDESGAFHDFGTVFHLVIYIYMYILVVVVVVVALFCYIRNGFLFPFHTFLERIPLTHALILWFFDFSFSSRTNLSV